MYKMTIANRKGGTGKTATAHAIGATLAKDGKRVLFVDLDAQANLTYIVGARGAEYGAIDAMNNPSQAAACVAHTPNGDILASTQAIGAANAIKRPDALRDALSNLEDSYDFCIIDTPPALGMEMINALTASEGLLIPAQADIFSYTGIRQLWETIQTVRLTTNPKLEIIGILITSFNARTNLSREMLQVLANMAEELQMAILSTKIRPCNAIKEAAATNTSIYQAAPRSNAAKDYTAAVTEILTIIGGKE